MKYEDKFPRYSTDADLQKLTVLTVTEITSAEQSASRIALNLLVRSATLAETFSDYKPDVEMVRVPGNELLLHVQSSGSYYYVKCVYDHLFPWQSEKRDFHSVSVVGIWSEFGDVSRIYAIDNMLAGM